MGHTPLSAGDGGCAPDHYALFLVSYETLASLYVALAAVCAVQVVRFHLKGFIIVMTMASASRAAFYLLAPVTQEGKCYIKDAGRYGSKAFQVLADFGSILFFTSFSLLGLFWAEVLYNASQQREKLDRVVKPMFLLGNVAVYTLQLMAWTMIAFLNVRSSATHP
eukprot:m51a1_g13517 hypothetical protein (165) ;mRNA; f:1110-1891